MSDLVAREEPRECNEVQLAGSVGIESIASLHQTVLQLCGTNQHTIVGCSQVEQLDVAAMQILLSAMLKPGGHIHVNLGVAGSPAWDAADAAGLIGLFEAAENVNKHDEAA
ncbi:MAG: STAS domain-containing protein [Planctomycetaceae bacterium]|nr:STAS domain-containing protein [Planctomycetaceae bacterium]